MTTLVDSSVWIDFFNGRDSPEALHFKGNLRRERFLVADLVLLEVLQGFRSDLEFERARDAMLKFQVVSLGSRQAAIRSAQNYRRLRAQGVTVRSAIDCLIASFCIANDCRLLHSDRDYSYFEKHLGLNVLRPG